MTFKFTKMHGCGNDFVVIDAVRQDVAMNAQLAQAIANRHTGIGCDQILLVIESPDGAGDFGYQIFNADGESVGQCGNGARCLARFIRDQGLSKADKLSVATSQANMQMEFVGDDLIAVDMGVPKFGPLEVPMAADQAQDVYQVAPDGETVAFSAVGLGNPHAVVVVDDVLTAPVEKIGVLLGEHLFFPEGANVGFMTIEAPDCIRLRVFERGAGETLACGSGACAAVVVGRRWHGLADKVTVDVAGGMLQVQWPGMGESVWLIGPATTVYSGEWIQAT